MPNFNIIKEVKPNKSFRVASVMGKFDLQNEHIKETFEGEIDLTNEWQVGCIVGASGTGKTTIAKELFPDAYMFDYKYKSESILDDFPQNLSVDEITKMFNAVGFSSPPSWLKPYSVLSNGEKMRVDLARAILTSKDLIVFDEFTSVVDRNVAKIGSAAVSKSIKRTKKKFIAVSCHYDIIEWLEPDWIYDTNEMRFKYVRGQLRRPEIELKIYERKGMWELFRKYHYLNTEINNSSRQFIGYINNVPIAFASVLPFPHSKKKNYYREHRTVVLPDYQGLGIGNKLSDYVANLYVQNKKGFISTTSAPSMIIARNKNKNWVCTRFGRVSSGSGKIQNKNDKSSTSCKRITTSWEYVCN
jgi:GNAT superfamily N-acetyltransferase